MQKKFKYFILFFMMISFHRANSQAPTGEITSYEIISPSQDTLSIARKYGDWWFGVFGGPQYDIYFGELNTSLFPAEPGNPFDTDIQYSGGSGLGIYAGLIGEYIPPGSFWSYALKISFLNIKNGKTETEPLNDEFKTTYRFMSNMNYLTVSPSVRYNLAMEGLHVFGGLDIGVSLSGEFDQEKYFINTGDIEHRSKTDFQNLNLRYGGHLGLGYDILMVEINNSIRVRFTPFASINFGSSYFSTDNSSWNSITFKAGLQVKLGPDKVDLDTFKFDPNYQAPVEVLASGGIEQGVSFPGFDQYAEIPASELKVVYVTRLKEAEKPKTADTAIVAKANVGRDEVFESDFTIAIEPDKKIYNFKNSTSTELVSQAEKYLDAVAKYLMANPKTIVRVVGHTDNTGATLAINQKRSEERADAAVRYLMNKGIPRSRILSRGRGALAPIKSNATAEGRKANNRVEIVVVSG